MKKLLFFFIDGLGLGSDSDINPARNFLREITGIPFSLSSVPADFKEGILTAADATGGIPGIPQSATGQATIMTGINAPALLGYHLTALPNATLVELVRERGVMKNLAQRGVTVTASNLYTPEFFQRRAGGGRNRLPVSSHVIEASGADFRFPPDYKEGRALFADLTNHFLRERGYEIPLIEPVEAADRMVTILSEADFVFHEYFATDVYAHKKREGQLRDAIAAVESFISALREKTDPEEVGILMVSDHGNAEDATSADHNRNPVPVLFLGRQSDDRRRFSRVTRLEEIYPAVLDYFDPSTASPQAL